MRKSIVSFGILALAGASMAQVVQVGPFVGALNDDFESYGGTAPHGPVFNFLGGMATNTSTDVDDIWMSTGHGLGGSKGLISGSTYMVANDGSGSDWNISFASAMGRIGGMWQSAFDDSSLKFEFFDGGMNALNVITVTPPNVGQLQWYGFAYSGGIGMVRVTSDQPFQIVDDFTADIVPEPVSIAALGLGAIALMRRRKI